MTTVCVAFRELIANILIIMVNIMCLPIMIWNCFMSFFHVCTVKKPIVPRVVAITGANAGIGEGIAHAYARDKASLVLIARNKERLEKVAEACKELGSPDVKIVQMDVSDTKAVADFFDEKTVEYGIELFIANAGVSTIPKTPLLDQMEKMFQINLLGALAGVNSVFKAMKKRGRGGQIAVVSSVFGFQVPPTLLNYGASKAALMSYCRDLRALGKDEGIKVNTIAPGYIATEMTAALPRRNKFFYLTPEKFGEQIKKGLEDDVAFISLPLHQYFLFSVSAALPISVRQWIAIAFHKTLDSIIKMNANTKEEKKII
ncbi:uncharacterized protein BX663DRAFT_499079 [Cokeromyces recurvatus]|uniref:uncharacterized protein n=1 Tax=Cokeromyces recurvatus TaxID=90255 RepID=UPI002220FDFA|nr:uncharacterized protein BX663DRAFT_499079 [Cokeromyces recurvatus]KAI7906166.1 hypothetical protein BX663DRAFT_499079 [Cokeromyces recurvatus]